jgi:DNA-binding NarL/FixJ family response regulator
MIPMRKVTSGGAAGKSNVRYWKSRLIYRPYLFPGSTATPKHFAVRIDHAGSGYFFPLGTEDADVAAERAKAIYQAIVTAGWDAVRQQFPRELIIGFEWCSNPVMWTYTTVHTLLGNARQETARPHPSNTRRVLVLESDPGIRRAIVWCIEQQEGLASAECDSAETFAAALRAWKPHWVALNRNLAAAIGFKTPGFLSPIQPGVLGITYSANPDGDSMFVATPGGATGYLLKRVEPARLFKFIVDGPSQLPPAANDLLLRVQSYFQEVLRPFSGRDALEVAKLTRRELEVLALLSKGYLDKEIAGELGISNWTVHNHVKKIFERLKVRSRTEAVVKFLEK